MSNKGVQEHHGDEDISSAPHNPMLSLLYRTTERVGKVYFPLLFAPIRIASSTSWTNLAQTSPKNEIWPKKSEH